MDPIQAYRHTLGAHQTRRHFLRTCSSGLGAAALTSLLGACGGARTPAKEVLHAASRVAPKARSVIFLHMEGGPSQLELFDYKPALARLDGQECPPSLIEGKRFAFIEGVPKMLGPHTTFRRHGRSGAYVSDVLPHFATIVDEVAFLKAVHTDQFNHAPAQLLFYTGHARTGRPSMGSWVTYGLGSDNDNLPGYVVLVSGRAEPSAGKSLWGSGFLPTVFQGVQCRSGDEPVLYMNDPPGVDRGTRRLALDAINTINQRHYEDVLDPEILTRIEQYELAFRMQIAAPEVLDVSAESEETRRLYGAESGVASFANNCLLARRLVENGVRFVQLFHDGWDSHGTTEYESINYGFVERCKEVDQAMTGLVIDLKRRGLLDDTLVVWGGEFGRTPMMENRGGVSNPFKGRDHHSEAFTMWLAGGGVKPGVTYGVTDEIGYYGIDERVHVHDLQATILHQLGLDHERLTYAFQGRDFRLTDVSGEVVRAILA
ncbi:MAG: DUF1501 domain-containing protein [Rhodothermales bacterium]|nr:DUF1501 domain-containing protein [Rhodothermales bacterium]